MTGPQHPEDDDAPPQASGATVRVLAAVVCRDDRYLVCRRPAHKRHGGLWEFPGGKIHAGETLNTELKSTYEHAAIVLGGDCAVDGQQLQDRVLYYLGSNRSEIHFSSRTGGRILLVGGTPFPETILMWWNFVARTREEIAEARADWENHHPRFGEVKAYTGPRFEAPELNRIARPNPVS